MLCMLQDYNSPRLHNFVPFPSLQYVMLQINTIDLEKFECYNRKYFNLKLEIPSINSDLGINGSQLRHLSRFHPTTKILDSRRQI